MTETFVGIGGDAAGMSAASKVKREDPERAVTVFEKGEWVSDAACGMLYYVKAAVDELDDLVTVTPEEFREERDIDLRTGAEVVDIDLEGQTVTVDTGDGTDEQPYDDLLVATGARIEPLEGLGLEGVFTVHDMDEADAIEVYVTKYAPETGAIVGVGVAPDTDLAEEAGIELGPTGAITTDEYGRTNDEDVYAAGDNAEATHVVTGEPDHVPLALTPNRAGRGIGQTVPGEPTRSPPRDTSGCWGCGGGGFLYVDRDIAEGLEPRTVGYRSVETPTADFFEFAVGARRFEVGSANPGPHVALRAAMDAIEEVGIDRIEGRVHRLAGRLADGVPDDRLLSPSTPESGLMTIDVDDPAATVERLTPDGIVVRALPSPNAIRASVHAVNTPGDVDRLLEGLEGERSGPATEPGSTGLYWGASPGPSFERLRSPS